MPKWFIDSPYNGLSKMISTQCENPVNGWEFSVFSKALAMQLLGFCVKFFEAKTVPLGFYTTGPTEAEYSLADSIFNTGI